VAMLKNSDTVLSICSESLSASVYCYIVISSSLCTLLNMHACMMRSHKQDNWYWKRALSVRCSRTLTFKKVMSIST